MLGIVLDVYYRVFPSHVTRIIKYNEVARQFCATSTDPRARALRRISNRRGTNMN